MTALDGAKIETPELKAEASQETDKVVVRLSGSAETHAMTAIGTMLKKLHAEVIACKLAEIVVDLRDLEFMNSSCFKAFVSWIGSVQEGPPDEQYRIRFLSDGKKHWQKRSLGALSCFGANLITIETG